MGFRILVRAPSGAFVSSLESLFEERPYALDVPTPEELDWHDHQAVVSTFQDKPPSVVVSAILPKEGEKIDGSFEHVATLCEAADIPLIQFSHYRVFGKTVSENELNETHTPKPRDEYGKQLLALEQAVGRVPKHIILRLSWVLGGSNFNIMDALVPKLVLGDAVFVSDHDFGSPVNVGFAAQVVLAMVQQILCGAENWGAFHLHGSDKCSEAELCDAMVRLIGAELGREVEMPLVAGVDDDRRLLRGNALLTGERCTNNFGIQLPSWRKGLKALVQNYIADNPQLKR